ncbi:MAG: carboxypeptidase regulatory-like domain-containing protein [Candidatus Omnitrophica bacterium]|nr:carboxypeptidase regulatory-like domain-containing protein [Candidatus Omnitrophota bacterium]
MGVEETKKDLMLKRIQLTIAILVGVVTLAVGVYNAKKTLFAKTGPGGVTIQVRTDKGQPASQASIEIAKVHGGVVAAAETRPDGTYAKQGLEPGNYAVKAGKSGFQPAMLVVAVEPGQTAELNVTLAPSSSPLRSAVEEVGASWLKNLGAPRSAPEGAPESNP